MTQRPREAPFRVARWYLTAGGDKNGVGDDAALQTAAQRPHMVA
jgi:hypothetical protein